MAKPCHASEISRVSNQPDSISRPLSRANVIKKIEFLDLTSRSIWNQVTSIQLRQVFSAECHRLTADQISSIANSPLHVSTLVNIGCLQRIVALKRIKLSDAAFIEMVPLSSLQHWSNLSLPILAQMMETQGIHTGLPLQKDFFFPIINHPSFASRETHLWLYSDFTAILNMDPSETRDLLEMFKTIGPTLISPADQLAWIIQARAHVANLLLAEKSNENNWMALEGIVERAKQIFEILANNHPQRIKIGWGSLISTLVKETLEDQRVTTSLSATIQRVTRLILVDLETEDPSLETLRLLLNSFSPRCRLVLIKDFITTSREIPLEDASSPLLESIANMEADRFGDSKIDLNLIISRMVVCCNLRDEAFKECALEISSYFWSHKSKSSVMLILSGLQKISSVSNYIYLATMKAVEVLSEELENCSYFDLLDFCDPDVWYAAIVVLTRDFPRRCHKLSRKQLSRILSQDCQAGGTVSNRVKILMDAGCFYKFKNWDKVDSGVLASLRDVPLNSMLFWHKIPGRYLMEMMALQGRYFGLKNSGRISPWIVSFSSLANPLWLILDYFTISNFLNGTSSLSNPPVFIVGRLLGALNHVLTIEMRIFWLIRFRLAINLIMNEETASLFIHSYWSAYKSLASTLPNGTIKSALSRPGQALQKKFKKFLFVFSDVEEYWVIRELETFLDFHPETSEEVDSVVEWIWDSRFLDKTQRILMISEYYRTLAIIPPENLLASIISRILQVTAEDFKGSSKWNRENAKLTKILSRTNIKAEKSRKLSSLLQNKYSARTSLGLFFLEIGLKSHSVILCENSAQLRSILTKENDDLVGPEPVDLLILEDSRLTPDFDLDQHILTQTVLKITQDPLGFRNPNLHVQMPSAIDAGGPSRSWISHIHQIIADPKRKILEELPGGRNKYKISWLVRGGMGTFLGAFYGKAFQLKVAPMVELSESFWELLSSDYSNKQVVDDYYDFFYAADEKHYLRMISMDGNEEMYEYTWGSIPMPDPEHLKFTDFYSKSNALVVQENELLKVMPEHSTLESYSKSISELAKKEFFEFVGKFALELEEYISVKLFPYIPKARLLTRLFSPIPLSAQVLMPLITFNEHQRNLRVPSLILGRPMTLIQIVQSLLRCLNSQELGRILQLATGSGSLLHEAKDAFKINFIVPSLETPLLQSGFFLPPTVPPTTISASYENLPEEISSFYVGTDLLSLASQAHDVPSAPYILITPKRFVEIFRAVAREQVNILQFADTNYIYDKSPESISSHDPFDPDFPSFWDGPALPVYFGSCSKTISLYAPDAAKMIHQILLALNFPPENFTENLD